MNKRQVVFIMTDTQRKDMLGCYGNEHMKTPHIDGLAKRGVRFEKGYTCQPVCGPARSALFTGTYPHSNGSWGNTMPLGDNVKTIGQRLQGEGIDTAYIGKWHLDGGDYFGMGQCPQGWDPEYWYDMRNYLEELTPEEREYSRRKDSEDIDADFTFGHRCSNRAMDFIKAKKEEDFFLVVSYDEPHGPFLCPNEYAHMYDDFEWELSENCHDTLENKPEHHRAWAGDILHADRQALPVKRFNKFFGCNSFVDHEIGRVLETIYTHSPEALIIYTSDHGDMLYSHAINNKGPAMYEEITNVPLIMSCKGLVEEESINTDPVSHIHMVPTILDYFSIAPSQVLEGKSLLSSLKSGETLADEAFIEFNRYEIDHDGFGGFQPIRCVTNKRYKLVVNLMCMDELYDLDNDPGEMKNLINDPAHGTIRNQLHDKLLNWMNDTRDPFRGYYWERRPWRLDARPATWDYTGMTRQRIAEEEPRQLDYGTGLEISEAVRPK